MKEKKMKLTERDSERERKIKAGGRGSKDGARGVLKEMPGSIAG
jgi:hypothetical protein